MQINRTVKEFDEALAKDENLRKAFEENCQKIAEAGEASSDGEAMVKAAGELGWQLSLEEIERKAAINEELSDDDLEQISGGSVVEGEDEYGHDNYCIAFWHCNTVTRHTETESKYVLCWNDYACQISVNPYP